MKHRILFYILVLGIFIAGCSKGSEQVISLGERVVNVTPTKKVDMATPIPTEVIATSTPEPIATVVPEALDKFEFTLSGKTLKVPFAYSELTDMGWYFLPEDYGITSEYIMNPGDKIYGIIRLNNDKYGTNYDSQELVIGLQNTSDSIKSILECDVYTIKIDKTHGYRLIDSDLTFGLSNGVTVGSTLEDILESFGEPQDRYTAEEYEMLTYSADNLTMKLYIYDEYNLAGVEFSKYITRR